MAQHNLSEESFARWQDVPSDGSLETFARLTNLRSRSLQVSEQGVIILPNNAILPEVSKDSNLFAETAKDVLVAMQDGDLRVQLYDDGREKRELILDSADVILPILLFLRNAVASMGLDILAQWIYDRWIRTDAKQPPSIRIEYAILDQHGIVVGWRRIEGPVTEVQRLLSEESQRLARQDSAGRVEAPTILHENAPGEWWGPSHRRNLAHAALAVARDLIQEAKEAINGSKMDVAETLFRRSLVKIREALLWEPGEKPHGKFLHDVGRRVHDIFGCELQFSDGQYWVTCPVMLSHIQGGLSTGGSGRTICSICGGNVLDCPHLKGHIYDGVLAKRHHDICNICTKRECEHKEGNTYDGVAAFGIVVELDLDHIAFVQNPANPLTVLDSYSMPKSNLLEMLPEDEQGRVIYGETVIHCHHCLVCNGT